MTTYPVAVIHLDGTRSLMPVNGTHTRGSTLTCPAFDCTHCTWPTEPRRTA